MGSLKLPGLFHPGIKKSVTDQFIEQRTAFPEGSYEGGPLDRWEETI